ncbi:MAG: dihydroorotate dehydrogenase [archaeon]
MKLEKIRIGDKEIWPFTIPSGIITTQVSCLERLAKEIPELGILTTKSIGLKPRGVPEGGEVGNLDPGKQYGNREPILSQYIPGGFINAVGLTNPGAEAFANELSKADFPKNKFLLASIFGKNAEEFVYVAKTLEDYVDGFELNLSCPHAREVGMVLGQDPEVVHEITDSVFGFTDKPIFAKLTPNKGNIGDIAKSAISAGAYGVTAINTVGPGDHYHDGHPILTNVFGGLSGDGIKPIGLKCVREVRAAIGEKVPIIGMGGIGSAVDVRDYHSAGADIFGIGSALAGMDDEQLREYYPTLVNDLENGTNSSLLLLQNIDMTYHKVKVREVLNNNCDFKIFRTNRDIQADPGQFVFAWIPGVGEKPFSVMDDSPLTLGVLEKGPFTKKFNSLMRYDSFYVRGPYGRGIDFPTGSDICLVGGGCGIAGIHLLAKRFSEHSNVLSILATKSGDYLYNLDDEFHKYGKLRIATENGTLGIKGLVTDVMFNSDLKQGTYFVNCGPRAMVDAVLPLELQFTGPTRIYSSLDYMTRCGVGICGSCADENGRRTCIEGPFMKANL